MRDEIAAIGDLFVQPGFQAGLLAGLVGAILVVALWAARPGSVPGWGLLLAAASAAGVANQFEVDSTWISGILVLVVAGAAVDVANRFLGKLPLGAVVSWLPGVIGAIWAANLVGLKDPNWVVAGLAGFTLMLAVGLWVTSRSRFAWIVGPMTAIAVGGSWVTVPETDIVIVFVGAIIPLALLTLRPISARLSASGAMAFAGLLGWVVMGGGIPRPWTVIGAWSAAAGIAVVAIVGLLRRDRPFVILAAYLVYAIVVTRVADMVDSLATMTIAAAVLLLATAVATWFLLGPGSESTPVVSDA